ncbi:MAG: glutathione S-transferase [Motiliproteus sp.]
MTLPILYSLQNCPYAMRARLAILSAQQAVYIRAISMKNKPAEMLAISPKGTVPVLLLETVVEVEVEVEVEVQGDVDGEIISEQDAQAISTTETRQRVIDASLDIMLWALSSNDPENLRYSQHADALPEMLKIIEENDEQFKPCLENYKHARRFHESSEEHYRLQCEPFVQQLEHRLAQHEFLMGSTPSLLDYALLPFVRQFSRVNRQLYLQGPYTHLQRWLNHHLQSRLFSKAMVKYPLWLDNHEECLFGR